MQFIILIFISAISVFFLDMIWLGYVAKSMYADSIGMLLRQSNGAMNPIWPAAVIVYFFIALGIVYFVLPKANGSYLYALLAGVVYGAVCYGIYDFTNYSILTNWPWKITLIDFFWGMFLCGTSSVITTFFYNRF